MLRALLALMFLLTGCPSESDAPTVVDVCVKSTQQCRMGGGQLGVCMMATDGTFTCASQH